MLDLKTMPSYMNMTKVCWFYYIGPEYINIKSQIKSSGT